MAACVIGAQEIVEGPVFEGDVLNPRVAAFVGIGGEAGYLKEDNAVIHLVIAGECDARERR
jgi:hypothetical protein